MRKEGSVTIETAIVLPILIMVIMSFFTIIKVIETHMVVQNVLNCTVKEIYVNRNSFENIGNLLEVDEKLTKNNKEILKKIEENFIKKGYNKNSIEKSLQIKNGLNGIYVKKNKIQYNKIELHINYNIKSPIFKNLISGLKICQKSTIDNRMSYEGLRYIWKENHFKRGNDIQDIFGKNVISPINGEFYKFDIKNQCAIELRTIDPTLKSYKNKNSIYWSISENIYKLSKYNKKVELVDKSGLLKKYTILRKKFIIVIPINVDYKKNVDDFIRLRNLANSLNIEFEVVQFGHK